MCLISIYMCECITYLRSYILIYFYIWYKIIKKKRSISKNNKFFPILLYINKNIKSTKNEKTKTYLIIGFVIISSYSWDLELDDLFWIKLFSKAAFFRRLDRVQNISLESLVLLYIRTRYRGQSWKFNFMKNYFKKI